MSGVELIHPLVPCGLRQLSLELLRGAAGSPRRGRSLPIVPLLEMGSRYVVQAGLELLASSHPPAMVPQSTGIIGSMLHAVDLFSGFSLTLFLPGNDNKPSFYDNTEVRLECNGAISVAHCNLCLLGSKTGFQHVSQAGLEHLTSGDPPASASQSAGITDEEIDNQEVEVTAEDTS
ncbi:hypothetical protein AAY473_004346 [Plecturocebus cupreus]